MRRFLLVLYAIFVGIPLLLLTILVGIYCQPLPAKAGSLSLPHKGRDLSGR